jgi:hypothetical protein
MGDFIALASGGDKPLDWIFTIALILFGLFLIWCCGWPLMKKLRKNKGSTNTRNDKYKGHH